MNGTVLGRVLKTPGNKGPRLRPAVLALLLAGGLLASAAPGCGKAKGGEVEKERPLPVRVQAAQSRDLVSDVYLSGEVQADVEVRVFSLVPERILSLKFEEGDRVKKGQVLAVIKGGALWQAVRQAKAGLAAARTQQQLAKIELDRTRKLFRTKTVAIAALQRAQAQYNVARSQVAQMQATVGQVATNMANVVIRAPIDGVVGQRFLSKGDLAGPRLPLCSIIQTQRVRVKAMATEFDVVKLHKGQPVRVLVPAFRGRVWTGKVDFLSPVIDRRTRSAWVTVIVENPSGQLRPGMFADMRVRTGVRRGVVMTLARAVQRRVNEEGKARFYVFVVRQGRAHLLPVEVGIRNGAWMEIRAGLKVGEPVVVLGGNQLREGREVHVVTRKSLARPLGARPAARPASPPRAVAPAAPRRSSSAQPRSRRTAQGSPGSRRLASRRAIAHPRRPRAR